MNKKLIFLLAMCFKAAASGQPSSGSFAAGSFNRHLMPSQDSSLLGQQYIQSIFIGGLPTFSSSQLSTHNNYGRGSRYDLLQYANGGNSNTRLMLQQGGYGSNNSMNNCFAPESSFINDSSMTSSQSNGNYDSFATSANDSSLSKKSVTKTKKHASSGVEREIIFKKNDSFPVEQKETIQALCDNQLLEKIYCSNYERLSPEEKETLFDLMQAVYKLGLNYTVNPEPFGPGKPISSVLEKIIDPSCFKSLNLKQFKNKLRKHIEAVLAIKETRKNVTFLESNITNTSFEQSVSQVRDTNNSTIDADLFASLELFNQFCKEGQSIEDYDLL